jgi:hypothetical protein
VREEGPGAARTTTVAAPRMSWAAGFAMVAASFGEVVPAAGWLLVAGQAFLLAWWTGNLRPRIVLIGLLVGLVGLAAGYMAALAVFFTFWGAGT